MRDKMHLEVGGIWMWDWRAGGRGGSGLSLDAVLMFEMYGEVVGSDVEIYKEDGREYL